MLNELNTLKEIYEYGTDAMYKAWNRADICNEQHIDKENDAEYRYYKGVWDGSSQAYNIIKKHLAELEGIISAMSKTM